MIEQTTANEQIKRLSGLDYYPRGEDQKNGLRELRNAAQRAYSEKVLAQVIDDVLATSNRCPSPAQLRGALWEQGEKVRVKRENCPLCEGVGFVTVFQLVTYVGKSFMVHKIEDLPAITNEEHQYRFQREMEENPTSFNQTVRSAARQCECRKTA